jgi:hypothetical protein
MKKDKFFLLCIGLFLLGDMCGMDITTKGRFDDKQIVRRMFYDYQLEEALTTVSALTLMNKQFNHDFNTPAFTLAFVRSLSYVYEDMDIYEEGIVKNLHTKGAYNYYQYSKAFLNLKHDAPKAVLRWINLGADVGYRISVIGDYNSLSYTRSALSNAVIKNLTETTLMLLKKGVDYVYEVDLMEIALVNRNEKILRALIENFIPKKHYCYNLGSHYAIQLSLILEKHHDFIWEGRHTNSYDKESVFHKALKKRCLYRNLRDTLKVQKLTEFIKKLIILEGFLIKETYIQEAQLKDDKELLTLIEQFDCGQNYGSHKVEKR